ncbi:hypothetical protein L8V77_03905, partial [Campylobacter sp. IFREMER_LSEM_CL2127]|uniref:beta strand repeat-containing protein n=1 Tax=Campylobacter sp. IFREMER_LSEM_CL2127 TaxID=2911619 RepID=UPI003996BB26|nr:hypothetical protein [Campylobacter sp. IFREMER_LSEM_CL2127]
MGNTTITNFTNGGTIKSTSGVGVNIASGTTISNLENTGTINGSDGIKVNSATLQNLENSGTISGSVNGVKVEGNGAIDTIINRGTIYGNSTGIYAIKKINTIQNYGTIKGNGADAIRIGAGSTIDNITNHGVIEGNRGGIYAFNNSYIKTAINSSTGTIITHTEGYNIDNQLYALGVFGGLYGSPQTDYLKNEGLILSAGAGMGASYHNKKNVQTIENSGTIVYNKGQNNGHESWGTGAGIYNYNAHTTLINNSGIMHVLNGIWLRNSSTAETILNSGTINAYNRGLMLQGGKVDTIKNTGTIIAGNLAVDIGSNAGTVTFEGKNSFVAADGITAVGSYRTTDSIALKDGATIAAINFNEDRTAYTFDYEGLALLNQGTINKSISLDGGSKIIGILRNSGNIKEGISLDKESKIIGALHNKNTIGGNISLNDKSYITSINNEKTIQGSIDLKNKSHIDSIINSGTIDGGIKLNDSTIGSITNNEGAKTDLDLSNNSVVGTITNNGDMLISRDETSSIGTFANNGNLK